VAEPNSAEQMALFEKCTDYGISVPDAALLNFAGTGCRRPKADAVVSFQFQFCAEYLAER